MNEENFAHSHEYWLSEDLEALMRWVIADNAEEFGHLTNCVIRCMYSSTAKRTKYKITYADCYKVPDRVKPICHTDFIITFYEPNVEDLDEDKLYILMYHELLHVGYDDGVCSLIPHDVEDFDKIIDKYGIHWEEVGV